MLNKCLLTEWRLDSHPGPKTPSPVLFCPAVSPALPLCSTHEATGLKARRWLPSVPLLHNLSVPRPPALQSCRPAYSQGEPRSDHPGGPSSPCSHSPRQQPGGQPTTPWDSTQGSMTEGLHPHPGSLLLGLPSLCLSFLICRMGMMVPPFHTALRSLWDSVCENPPLAQMTLFHQNEVP